MVNLNHLSEQRMSCYKWLVHKQIQPTHHIGHTGLFIDYSGAISVLVEGGRETRLP